MSDLQKRMIGIDLGGTQIRAGLFQTNGQLVKKEEAKTLAQEGPDAVIGRIKQTVKRLIDGESLEGVEGIGIGCPGPLNPYTGLVLSPANLPGWDRIPLKQTIEETFSLPVYLHNDANAAALGEYMFGKGKGEENVVYITVSTGVGAGVVVDGHLLLGEHGSAAEVGHMVINPQGPPCGCGNNGCFEAYASGTGIVRRTKALLAEQADVQTVLRSVDELETKHVFDAAKQGDAFAESIVHETQKYLGIGIANVVNLYNPKVVVFGGGVSQAGDYLFDSAIKTAKQYALAGMFDDVQFTYTAHGGDVGLIGAAALVEYNRK